MWKRSMVKKNEDYRTQRALRVHSDVLFQSSSSGAYVSVELKEWHKSKIATATWACGKYHCIAGVYSVCPRMDDSPNPSQPSQRMHQKRNAFPCNWGQVSTTDMVRRLEGATRARTYWPTRRISTHAWPEASHQGRCLTPEAATEISSCEKGLLAVDTWNSKRKIVNFVPMLGSIIENSGNALDESHMPLGWPLSIDGAVRQFCSHKTATIQELDNMLQEYDMKRSSVE